MKVQMQATLNQDSPTIPLVDVWISEHDRFPEWTFRLRFNDRGQVGQFEMVNDTGAEVTASWLRTVAFDELRRIAQPFWQAWLRELAANEAPGLRVSEPIAEEIRRVADGGDDRLVFYAATARDYLRKCNERGTSPARDHAAELFISVRALQKRLKVAEELGVFEPAGHGRAGGRLTPVGIAVLEQNGEESQ